jgi:hypothetical protein
VVVAGLSGSVWKGNYSASFMSALPKQSYSPIEATRDDRVVPTEPDIRASVPLQGLRSPLLRLYLADEIDSIQRCFAVLAPA